MIMKNVDFIAPDGGWGWVVVIATAVNNMVSIPILQGFGLIFKDRFEDLEFTATQITTIVNFNSFFGMILGIFNGPLITIFGFRKTAILGTLVFTSGVVFTAYASSFIQFIIGYGMLTSLGMGIAMSSFLMAINSYFLEKRGRAMGIAMTLTGIGPILVPQLTRYLLYVYHSQGTMLILGGCSLHALVSAMLLHPVKWHAKKKVTNLENGNILETPLLKEICPDCSEDKDKSNLISYQKVETQSVNLGSSLDVFDQIISSENTEENNCDIKNENGIVRSKEKICQKCGSIFVPEKTLVSGSMEQKLDVKKTRLQKFVYLFGFDLLRDLIFVNITVGMSLAIFAETNFSTLMPFILKEMDLTTSDISIVMSVLGSMDLLLRGISPFIGDRLRKSPRTMYLISLSLLIIGRSLMMFTRNFVFLMLVIVWLGIAKGIRSVYSNLVIPNYVPLNRLPSASSLQQILVGFLSLGAGPLIGCIRDVTGNYILGIAFINCMTGLTIFMWMMEMFLGSSKRKSETDQ